MIDYSVSREDVLEMIRERVNENVDYMMESEGDKLIESSFLHCIDPKVEDLIEKNLKNIIESSVKMKCEEYLLENGKFSVEQILKDTMKKQIDQMELVDIFKSMKSL